MAMDGFDGADLLGTGYPWERFHLDTGAWSRAGTDLVRSATSNTHPRWWTTGAGTSRRPRRSARHLERTPLLYGPRPSLRARSGHRPRR